MEKITATLRIATKQQYCYIEITVTGTPQEIISKYIEITKLYNKMQVEADSAPF